jgi:hypothetical protein
MVLVLVQQKKKKKKETIGQSRLIWTTRVGLKTGIRLRRLLRKRNKRTEACIARTPAIFPIPVVHFTTIIISTALAMDIFVTVPIPLFE